MHHDNIISFDKFKIDLSTRELFIEEQIIPIQNKSFDLLVFLIENRERAISKDELLDKLWGGRYVSEGVLAHAASKLRTALKDNHKQGKFIRTIHGFGLQFVAKLDDNNQHYSTSILHKPNFKTYIYALVIVVIFAIALYTIKAEKVQNNETSKVIQENSQLNNTLHNKPIKLAFFSDPQQNNTSSWKTNGISAYFNDLLGYSNNTIPINFIQSNYNTKNDTLTLNINPSKRPLGISNVILASQNKNILSLQYLENNIIKSQIQVSLDDLNIAISNVNKWICSKTIIDSSLCQENIESIASDDSFVVENYMRGMDALQNLNPKKAKSFFAMCLQQDEEFVIARLAIAQTLYRLSRYKESISQAQTVIKTNNNPLVNAKAQLILGKSQFRLSQLSDAKKTFSNVANNNNINQVPRSLALIELAKIDKEELSLDAAIVKVETAKKIFVQLGLPAKKAQATEMLGDIYVTQGNIDNAKQSLTEALKIYEEINDILGIHGVSATLGGVYRRLGNYNAAYELAKQRMVMAKKIKDPINVIGAHLQLSYILIELGKLKKAQKEADAMSRLALQENESVALYFAYTLEAEIANSLLNYTLAIDKSKQALTIAIETKQEKKRIETLCVIGDYLINAKHYQQAQIYLDDCYNLAKTNAYTLFQAVSQLYLASLHNQQGNIDKVELFLQQALSNANKINHDKLINEIYMEYYYLYINNNVQKAEMYLEKIPEIYKQNFQYLIALAEINYKQNHLKTALQLALQAKQKANGNWQTEQQILLDEITAQLKFQE